ncbi:MAG: hypothetical protein WEA81_01290 [Dehalococcoidia bacterium]
MAGSGPIPGYQGRIIAADADVAETMSMPAVMAVAVAVVMKRRM